MHGSRAPSECPFTAPRPRGYNSAPLGEGDGSPLRARKPGSTEGEEMRAFKTGMVALALVATAGIGGCEKIKESAGLECKGTIAEGSLEITGNAQIDGVLPGA